MGHPVEIEFAVKHRRTRGRSREFGLLQMRPLVVHREQEEFEWRTSRDKLICQSNQVLGNGIIEDIRDIVVVDYNVFDR